MQRQTLMHNVLLGFFWSFLLFSFAIGFSPSVIPHDDPAQHSCDEFGEGPISVAGEGEACLSGEKNTNYECTTGIGQIPKFAGNLVYLAGFTLSVTAPVEEAANDRCTENLDANLLTEYLNCQASCQAASEHGLSCTASTITSTTPCIASCSVVSSALSIDIFGITIGVPGDYQCESNGSGTFQCDCVGYEPQQQQSTHNPEGGSP